MTREYELAAEVFRRFSDREIVAVTELGGGSVNRTFRVDTPEGAYICQRLSRVAFAGAADAIAYNYLRYRDACDAARGALPDWRAPQWLRDGEGRLFSRDGDGGCWRAYPMLPGRTFDAADALPDDGVCEFARGLAALHFVLDRFDGRPRTVIPRFHDLDFYLDEYRAERGGPRADADVERVIDARAEEILRARPFRREAAIHADTKLANALFAPDGRVTAFIDTDTVSAGSRLIDVADSVRSIAGAHDAAGELRFRRARYDAFVSAYLSSPLCALPRDEAECIPQALMRITFELGVRFYTDYLRGNPYFRAKRPEDTLRKARRQFALLGEMQRSF